MTHKYFNIAETFFEHQAGFKIQEFQSQRRLHIHEMQQVPYTVTPAQPIRIYRYWQEACGSIQIWEVILYDFYFSKCTI